MFLCILDRIVVFVTKIHAHIPKANSLTYVPISSFQHSRKQLNPNSIITLVCNGISCSAIISNLQSSLVLKTRHLSPHKTADFSSLTHRQCENNRYKKNLNLRLNDRKWNSSDILCSITTIEPLSQQATPGCCVLCHRNYHQYCLVIRLIPSEIQLFYFSTK